MRGEKRDLVMAVIVGNRDFFPDSLVEEGRQRVLKAIDELGLRVLTLSTDDTKYGAVETREDAQRCARLLSEHRHEIGGILVTLPNFGDESSAADAIRAADLHVPVLVHAFPDTPEEMDPKHRRDAFCGKLSLCNNLVQYGIRFTDTTAHVESPESDMFKADIKAFAAICRIVTGLQQARIGAIGTRPAAFKTVRFSEKILEKSGISVESIDLAEIIAQAKAVPSSDLTLVLEQISAYIPTDTVPREALEKMAQLSVVLRNWIAQEELNAIAFQCWTAIERLYGVVPCTVMSMLSQSLIPSACETDVMGALSMYALQLAGSAPAALLDWNNNYGEEDNKGIVFHCSNVPSCFFGSWRMSYHDIISGTVGKENTYGTCVGQMSPGPATFFRISTDDATGGIVSYVAEGRFTDNEISTFGGYGVVEIPEFRSLLRLIASRGFEHHVAVTKAHVQSTLEQAVGKYLGWELYSHPLRK